MTIVKIQRSLMPPDGPALIYAEGGTYVEHRPMNQQLRILLGDANRVFVRAEYSEQLGWKLGERVSDQAW